MKKRDLEDVLRDKFSELELDKDSELLQRTLPDYSAGSGKSGNFRIWLVAASVTLLMIAGLLFWVMKPAVSEKQIAAPVIQKEKPDTATAPVNKEYRKENQNFVQNHEVAEVISEPLKTDKPSPAGKAGKINQVYVADAHKSEFILPDSSKVFLNKHSRLEPGVFDDKGRVVTLKGEGYFEVKNLSGVPFKILCGNSVIEVIGTAFNVKPAGADSVVVIVSEGKVKFSSVNDAASFVYLTAGEKGVYSQGRIDKSLNADLNYLIWKTKVLTFSNTRLGDVLSTMEEYFGTEITVQDKAILNCHLTGKFRNPSLKSVLDFLKMTKKIDVAVSEKGYILTGNGCN
jgi:hypothetical protein